MSSLGSPNPFLFGGKKTYESERSLRFDPNDTYMERTPSSAGNRKIFTISIWFKLGILKEYSGSDGRIIFATGGGGSGSYATSLGIRGDVYGGPKLEFTTMLGAGSGSNYGTLQTSAMIRDPSAWYHVVVKVDTTQSTASNRMKMYINGVEETSFSTSSYPDQNADTYMNVTDKTGIGANRTWANQNTKYNYFGGYLAEFYFLDGTAYDASYFGETDSTTGQWIPIEYTGGNYGTNGFYLNFSDNSGTTATTLGKDSSGNGNNFTPNNFSVAAGAGNDSLEDTPTNNFCTLNPITYGSGGGEPSATLSNGNLDFTESSSNNRTAVSTFGLKTGKWYFELLCTNTGTFSIGLTDFDNNQGSFYRTNGSYSSSFGGGGASGYSTWTTNDVIGVAIDSDSGKIWYAKNNTWQSGDPATGNSPTNTFTTGLTLHTEAFTDNSSGTKSGSFNYGQRAFTYTPPTGYQSICSANLPDPTINLPNKHFDTTLYTGNGGTNNITGLSFEPDWVWMKNRSAVSDHILCDQIRGLVNLRSNQTTAEQSNGSIHLQSFNSDGFTVAGTGANSNSNGDNFVAWNWDAGETDGKTYTVTVVSDSGNKYRFDGFGTSAVTLDLAEGGTYIFNYPSAHPLRFSTTADGTHGGGSEYTTGVSSYGNSVTITVAASAPTLYYYCTQHSGMGGQVNTNSTLGSSNFDGAIQSTVKVNATVGFSITNFYPTAAGTAVTTGHGLGVAPSVVIVKSRGSSANWDVLHMSLGSSKKLYLNGTNAEINSGAWGSTDPTSSVFTYNPGNQNNNNQIAYSFSEVAGYSKFGSYTGNGSTDGTFVFTGFRPAWVMVKRSDSTGNWFIIDNKRDTFNEVTKDLVPNSSGAETDNPSFLDFLSNGFKLRTTGTAVNAGTIIYLAFAESPFKYARAR